jgi:type IV pilus assembly protein PilB
MKSQKLKEILIKNKYLDGEKFEAFQKEATAKKLPLEILLVQKGVIKDEDLGKLISQYLGYPFISLQKAHIAGITIELLAYIPEVVAFSQQAIFFEETKEGILKLATANPDNYEFIKQLEQKTGKKVEVYYVTPFNLDAALRRFRGDLKYEVMQLIEKSEKQPLLLEEAIVRLVNLFIEYAYVNQATDIHITPLSDTIHVRFRIDGILYKVVEYPSALHERITSRIKILARLRIDERAAAQDGRFSYLFKGESIDVRVSVVPVSEGENVVLRLLGQRGKKFFLSEVGLPENELRKIEKAAKGSWGMIMSVGPTGCGKTTTMYAILHYLNQSEVNIMTIEDPIEYKIEGVQQIQVNPKKKITFAAGLRSIVRQDPDIILVGEIRDEETTKIAINSAMTGHLVLSTLHANDAATALVRLIEMGAEPFLVASAVSVIIAQRLVRKTCLHCAQRVDLTVKEVETISNEPDLLEAIKTISGKKELSQIQVYKGKGCKFCEDTGYFGRIGIFEVMPVTAEIQKLVVGKIVSKEIREKAIMQGMYSMIYDGANKIIAGITAPEEIIKILKA